MIALSINLNGDGALAHLGHVEIEEATSVEVLLLDGGMSSGKPSVTLHLEVDGRHIIAQTSARLFCTAAKMIETRHPDLFQD
jgi:hypothetical protein